MKIYLDILIQLKGGLSFCFQYSFSIKYDIICQFGPFTTFKHWFTIGPLQTFNNIYSYITKRKFREIKKRESRSLLVKQLVYFLFFYFLSQK